MNPTFDASGEKVIFSGEMMNSDFSEPGYYDLFELTLSDKKVQQLTQTPWSESEPEVLPDGTLLYVRDRNDKGEPGFNLYKLDPSSPTPQQLTNFIGGGFSPRYRDGVITYVGFNAGSKHIYQMPLANELAQSTVPSKPTSTARFDYQINPIDHELALSNLRPKKEQDERVLLTLSSPIDSPKLIGPERPYKFRASTDLFLPFFFYSTLDGLVVADIYQGSDYLGNHMFQQQMQYASGADYLDLSVAYTYQRYRPAFTLGFQLQTYFNDADQTDQIRDTEGIALMNYPLDRVSSVFLGGGVSDQDEIYTDDSLPDTFSHARYWTSGYTFDTITGRYLVPTRGFHLQATYQEGADVLGGNQRYHSGLFEVINYAPLPRESTWAARLFTGRSTGEEFQTFRLGGIDRIRAVSANSNDLQKSNVVIVNNELRLRLAYLNARTKYLFPDFFTKAAYLLLFDDAGAGWITTQERRSTTLNSVQNTAGLGVSFPTFILQSYSLYFTIQWAKRTDTGTQVWYLSIAPAF